MSIGFLYPDRNIGGAQLLFARLAYSISNMYPDINVYYVDYDDGFSASWLRIKSANVQILTYSNEHKVQLPENLTLILPFDKRSVDICKSRLSIVDTKFIFWFIEPSLLLPFFYSTRLANVIGLPLTKFLTKVFFYKRFSSIGKLLIRSANNNGLVYMDGENTKIPMYYYNELEKDKYLLPVPIEAKEKREKTKSNHTINCAWVGRLAYQKRSALITILNDLDTLDNDTLSKIVFHIVGDGADYNLIKKVSEKIKFKIIFHGAMENGDLECFLRENIDLLFAMGTSALEGASLGIPTVLMDAITSTMSGTYKYKWVFNTINFTLGRRHPGPNNTMSIQDVMHPWIADRCIEDLSDKSFEYCKRHHLDNITHQLVTYARKCKNNINKSEFY